MLRAIVCKRLASALDQANNVIIVTVARIRVLNIISMQESNIELGVMPDFRAFFFLHHNSLPTFIIILFSLSCRILLYLRQTLFDCENYPAKIEDTKSKNRRFLMSFLKA